MSDTPRALANRRRATRDDQKQERRQDILDEAWRLFQATGYQAITMSEVAERAGLAKGTLYLYFKTKEELFLAIQVQQLEHWFAEIGGRLRGLPAAGPAELLAAVAGEFSASLTGRPALTRLLAILHSALEQNLDLETARSFKLFLLRGVDSVGGELERRLPFLGPGEGGRLLIRIHALVIGIQHLADPSPLMREALAEPGLEVFAIDFAAEFNAALLALLHGTAALAAVR